MTTFWTTVRSYLDGRHADIVAFWTGQTDTMPVATVEAHCDVVYSLYLLGQRDFIAPQAVQAFVNLLAGLHLPGWQKRGDETTISVHNCAYAFGALNIISDQPADLFEQVLAGRTLEMSQLINPDTHVPKFPPKWAHHNWRVSHWIGGVPSIILSIARSGARQGQQFADLIVLVRDATDSLVNQRTGLLRAYRSDLIQALFRLAYGVRHDPVLADVGGVSHLLWIDHVLDRRYVASEAILSEASALLHRHTPFMEGVPYCLDFDIVQALRTAANQNGGQRKQDQQRALTMMADIEKFFAKGPPDTYTLHKVPGALATYHECLLVAHPDGYVHNGVPATDVIKRAYWL